METRILEHDGQLYVVLPPGEVVPPGVTTKLVEMKGEHYRVLPAGYAGWALRPPAPAPAAKPAPKPENWLQTLRRYLWNICFWCWVLCCISQGSMKDGSKLFEQLLRATWHTLLAVIHALKNA